MTKEEKHIKQLLATLNTDPIKAKLVQKHPVGGFLYIPIEYLEVLFEACFGDWEEEITHMALRQTLGVKTDKNGVESSVLTTVCAIAIKISFYDPTKGAVKTLTGAGSCSVEGKQSAEMLAPKARTEAFKNAITNYARLFGKGLNRKLKSDDIAGVIQRMHEGFTKAQES